MQNKIKQSETITLKRSEITPADYNPRKITDDARKALKKSIKDNGIIGGMVWNKQTGNLVSGHQKLNIADEINKYESGNDYEIKVEVIDVDIKKEKELNIFFNSKAVQGEMDYKKLAQIFPDIDAALAGLDDVDIQLIEVELPDSINIEIPSFEPQEDKKINAEYEKSITQDLSNTIHHPEASILETERKEATELTPEEKKAKIKEIKEKVKENTVLEGDPYFTISFSDYDAKVMFLEYLGFNPEDKFIKGEEFQEKIEETYAN
ncbi:DNA methylase [Chryseobacterium sp. T16E-39]|uniref:DNA methylase n=1 Tax=Chryseobacterium sp. T16E-39 TaxID=2015076 RepID=UPI000B5B2405|nr:DNA methylase [Chryseobacterium sp. T16E-39]ASK29746.1 DNA methylase [Chryseobacterium sp. T16E-39]